MVAEGGEAGDGEAVGEGAFEGPGGRRDFKCEYSQRLNVFFRFAVIHPFIVICARSYFIAS